MTVTLKFTANPGKTPSGVNLQTPGSATFIFDGNGAHLQSAGTASLSVFSSAVNFTFANSDASWDAELGKVVFVGSTNVPALTISNGQKVFLQFSSQSSSIGINDSAWVPDVQTTVPSTAAEASSAGSLALYLKAGLEATFSNQTLRESALQSCFSRHDVVAKFDDEKLLSLRHSRILYLLSNTASNMRSVNKRRNVKNKTAVLT